MQAEPAGSAPALMGALLAALYIGDHIPKSIGFIFRQMKCMTLPIEFHAVPAVSFTHFANVRETILAHFGDGHVPRCRIPL